MEQIRLTDFYLLHCHLSASPLITCSGHVLFLEPLLLLVVVVVVVAAAAAAVAIIVASTLSPLRRQLPGECLPCRLATDRGKCGA